MDGKELRPRENRRPRTELKGQGEEMSCQRGQEGKEKGKRRQHGAKQ